jgi:hypothetical protein
MHSGAFAVGPAAPFSAMIPIFPFPGEELLGEPHDAIHFVEPAGRFSGPCAFRAPAYQHASYGKFSRSKSSATSRACLGLDDAEDVHHAFIRHRDAAAR